MASASKKKKRDQINLDHDTVKNMIAIKSDRVQLEQLKSSKYDCLLRVVVDDCDTVYVICKTCNDDDLIKYDTKYGTHNVQKHIDGHQKSSSKSMQLKMSGFGYHNVSTSDKKLIARTAAVACATDFRPFTFVEGEGFIQLIQSVINVASLKGRVDASQLLPCANTVKNHVESLSESLRESLIEHLRPVESINVTTDHWMEKYSNINYMTMTISYFHPTELKLMNRVLETFMVKDKKSNTTLDSFLRELDVFHIKNKLKIVVSDNANNMKCSFKDLTWEGCKAHDSQLVQKHAFGMNKGSKDNHPIPSLKLLFDVSKEIVEMAKRGSINSNLEKGLVQECPTRWDTNYDMFASILNNFDSLKDVLLLKPLIEQINKGLLDEVTTLIQPLKQLRCDLSKNKSPTFHLVAMAYDTIMDHMEAKPADSWSIKILKNRFKSVMKLKFKVSRNHVLATFLCPLYSKTFTFSDTKLVKDAHDLLIVIDDCSDSEEIINQCASSTENHSLINENSAFQKYMDIDRSSTSKTEYEKFKTIILR